jgi:hypothetical protein
MQTFTLMSLVARGVMRTITAVHVKLRLYAPVPPSFIVAIPYNNVPYLGGTSEVCERIPVLIVRVRIMPYGWINPCPLTCKTHKKCNQKIVFSNVHARKATGLFML